jgi:quercetin dioxygenase-like cupin family protein
VEDKMPIHHNMLGSIPAATERTFVAVADSTLGTQTLSVHENVLNPEAVVPWHQHEVEEVIVCVSGLGECTFQGLAPEQFRAGSVLIIPPRTLHTIKNIGAERLIQFAILGGASPGTKWLDTDGSVSYQVTSGEA